MSERSRNDDGTKRRQRPGVRLGTPHQWQRHGGYSLLRQVTKGDLDGRLVSAQAIKGICYRLARDLGAEWADLSEQQRLLIESVATKATVLSLMVGYALASEVMAKDGKLQAPLGGQFLAWSNSLRLDLQTLGLEKRMRNVVDLSTYVEEKYGDKDANT